MVLTVHETVWITMPDGTRLAATIWMPEGDGPFPAVLEFLPYRRGDGTAPRDESTYPGFAEAGIAGVRVDSRGNGDSDGVFDDEYSPQELADICDVIAWIADRDWSNGAVGLMGISWGGFNGLQVAAMRPPALKAVISIASTADRYSDDIHYFGGCLLSANVYWAGTMLTYASRPPDPEVVGNRWAEIWRERLEAEPMLLEVWLNHQRRDDYWKHGSICEDWDAIQCPVWVIAGWGDGYRNCPATLAEHLGAPVKAMVGPWVHKYPHFAWPKPRADFVTMASDWWHQWLSGEARGVEDWPDYSAYLIEAARPSLWRGEEAGRWIGTTWPGNPPVLDLPLGADGVLGSKTDGTRTICSPQHCGTTGGEFFTLAPNSDMPCDQRADDALSLCWDSAVHDAPVDLLGRAELRLSVSIDRPQGNLIARLVDLHPDGTATLITRGVLNLCHRNGSEAPEPMIPGQAEAIVLPLDHTGYTVRAGHRLRLALSTTYFPMVLPSPAPVTATVRCEDAALWLPLLGDAADITVPEPANPAPLPVYPSITPGSSSRSVTHELSGGKVRYTIAEDSGLNEIPRNGMQARDTRDEMWEIDPNDPVGTTGTLRFISERKRGAWHCTTESTVRFVCHADRYETTAEVIAWDGETEFHRKSWAFSIPRDHI